MSNVSPVLNGENTGGVVDFQTDASVNMVAAIHDHISCAKPVPGDTFNSQDNKGEILSYSCEFDHMYASLTEGTTGQHDNAEITHLKELLLLHLDLIQQQSEQLVTKDKQLSTLRQENETLRQRLERMDRRVTLHKHREGSDNLTMSTDDNTFPPPVLSPSTSTPSIVLTIPPEEIKEDFSLNMLFNNNNVENNSELDSVKLEPVTSNNEVPSLEATTSATCYVAKRRRREEERESGASSEPRRKRKVSWTSSSVHSDVVSEGRRTPKCAKEPPTLENKRSPKKTKTSSSSVKEDSSKETDIRTTERQYYSAIGDQRLGWLTKEESEADEPIETDTVTVPSWRVKTYNSCYTMEGTENLDDEVFNKRHSRLEIDERRRKRWDVQRIREQRQIEKLKQRESSRRSSTATRAREGNESPVDDTLWPDPDEIEFIEVCERLPLSAFGVPMMDFPPSEFSLPWLTSARTKPPTSLPAPNRRRHCAKR